MRNIPYSLDSRVETGSVRFGTDWPGVFIRGDDALAYATAIEKTLAPQFLKDGAFGRRLVTLLRSCEATRK